MSFLIVKNLLKIYPYDKFPALNNISFDVEKGETVSLVLGAQGGKTTLAKILIGEENIFDGEILYDGNALNQTSPKDRDIAYIVLPLLFNKYNVTRNASFGLIQRKIDSKIVSKKVEDGLLQYGLSQYALTKTKKLDLTNQCRLALLRAYLRTVRLAIFDNVIGLNEEIDKLIDNQISENCNQGVTSLLLCDKISQARGRIIKFTKLDWD